jgi:hypothetical protein
MELSGFNIEADFASLAGIHTSPTTTQQPQPASGNSFSHFSFSPPLVNTDFSQREHINGDGERKVFFITNCGSLLGRTIAQVALDRGHLVAACAREKHLGDLNVPSSAMLN